ncbi:MAG: class I adenylate-forming enzyme family protein [Candidatus Zixiibacteriota bacterium]
MSTPDTDKIWKTFIGLLAKHGSRTAVTSPSGNISFKELRDLSEELADHLGRSGIGPGDVIGHMFESRASFVIAFLALCRLTASIALVSTVYQKRELEAITDKIKPRAFLCDQQNAETIGHNMNIADRIMIGNPDSGYNMVLLIPQYESGVGPKNASTLSREHDFEFPVALIKFTSGSTGEPKAVALSAKNIMADAANIVETLDITGDDVILTALPLSHSYGFDLGVLPLIFSGSRLIIHEHFIPRLALRTIVNEAVTIFPGVPSMYRFFDGLSFEQPPDLSHIRYFLSCTAPLSKDMIFSFQKKFGIPICQHYGSSETGATINQIVSKVMIHPESIGVAMKNIMISILDENGLPDPIGQTGEVVVSGDNVAMGYLMGRPPNRNPLKEGKYFTGDLAYIDDGGFIYLEGRIDTIINVGGNKVSPQEVTEVLEKHPAVKEAVAMGIRDHNNEEIVVAVVSLSRETGENNIIDFCHGKLAPYKIPRRIEFRDELPRSASGKIKIRPEDYGF